MFYGLTQRSIVSTTLDEEENDSETDPDDYLTASDGPFDNDTTSSGSPTPPENDQRNGLFMEMW